MSKVYQCHRCGGTFVPNDDVKVACAVLHGVDDCCHYGEQQISPTKDPNNELDELELKSPKNSIENLERELIIYFWRVQITALIDKKVTEALNKQLDTLEAKARIYETFTTQKPWEVKAVGVGVIAQLRAQLSKPKEEPKPE